MAIAILIVFLALLGVFALQNWSPQLAVVFLGIKTLELPLAVTILMAIAVGILTSFFLQFLSYLSTRSLQGRIQQEEAPKQGNSSNSRRETSSTAESRYTQPINDDVSDWEEDEAPSETEPEYSEEWDDWEQSDDATSEDVIPESKNYEVRQEPTSSSKSGSMYSYSYREPKNSGVGKTEAVYDAEYRVITPPYRGTPKSEDDWVSNKSDEEDWGFDDEDDLDENRGESSDRIRP